MGTTVEKLEVRRKEIYRQMEALGDFRPGTISVNYRKCGKKKCICREKGHPGHGPQYLWNATRKGKSLAQNLHLGPELDKVQRETSTYKRFNQLYKEVTEVNEQICRQRPIPKLTEERELEALKKKLKKKFLAKLKKKFMVS